MNCGLPPVISYTISYIQIEEWISGLRRGIQRHTVNGEPAPDSTVYELRALPSQTPAGQRQIEASAEKEVMSAAGWNEF